MEREGERRGGREGPQAFGIVETSAFVETVRVKGVVLDVAVLVVVVVVAAVTAVVGLYWVRWRWVWM